MLSAAQLQTLKTSIAADGTLSALPNYGDGPYTIAAAYNATAAPDFIVYRTSVSIRETGEAFNGAEWAGMTSANHSRLQTVAQYLASYNASKADVRAMFNDIWSGAGGTNTRAALAALWTRKATRAEKLFASSGAGTAGDPAIMGFEGRLTPEDVMQARNS